MLDGVAAMTRFLRRLGSRAGHRRGPGHGRQLEVVGHRGRAAAAPGPRRRQLDLAQGGRGGVPAPGPAVPPVRRRGGRHGVRRAGPGRQRGAAGRRPHARPQAAHRAGGLRDEDIILDPNIFAIATGIEEHADYANAFFEATRRLKALLPGRAGLGRRVQRLVRVPRQRPGPRGDPRRVPVPRDPRRAGHGDRQRGRAAAVRRHRPGPAGAGRGRRAQPAGRRDRAAARDRAALRGRRGPGAGRRRPGLALAAGRRAAHPRPRRGHRRLDRRGHRGGAAGGGAAAGRHRGAADGRDGHRRRPVRVGADVPAPGRQERPGDEEGRRPPRAVPRGAARGHGTASRHDRHGDGQGRRPRHRQEHRRRRAGLQRLRGDRPRGHGAGVADPRDRAGGGRGPDRRLRADHAVASTRWSTSRRRWSARA